MKRKKKSMFHYEAQSQGISAEISVAMFLPIQTDIYIMSGFNVRLVNA